MSSIAESQTLRKTALNALHRRLSAKMVDFGGWDMPVEYPSSGGLVKEHLAVRSGVGMFDVSHMGDIRIKTAKSKDGALAESTAAISEAVALLEDQAIGGLVQAVPA